MPLYIANSTQQTIKLHLRFPEKIRAGIFPVPAGHQIEVPQLAKEKSGPVIDAILEQLHNFGARDAKEIKGKLKEFPGIIYSLDKPVSIENIEIGHEAVGEYQDRRAADEAVKSAKGFDMALRDKNTRRRLTKTTEVEVEQDVPARAKKKGDEVAMKVTIAEDGKPE